jgi:hypothetical protein
VKRTAHLTVQVSERPSAIVAAPAPEPATPAGEETPKRARAARPKRAVKASGARKKTAGARKKAPAKRGARKKTAKS